MTSNNWHGQVGLVGGSKMGNSDWQRVRSEHKGFRTILQEAYPGIYWVCYQRAYGEIVYWFGVDKGLGVEVVPVIAEVYSRTTLEECDPRFVYYRLVSYPDVVPPDKFWADPAVQNLKNQITLFDEKRLEI